jgi:hypothetical protein
VLGREVSRLRKAVHGIQEGVFGRSHGVLGPSGECSKSQISDLLGFLPFSKPNMYAFVHCSHFFAVLRTSSLVVCRPSGGYCCCQYVHTAAVAMLLSPLPTAAAYFMMRPCSLPCRYRGAVRAQAAAAGGAADAGRQAGTIARRQLGRTGLEVPAVCFGGYDLPAAAVAYILPHASLLQTCIPCTLPHTAQAPCCLGSPRTTKQLCSCWMPAWQWASTSLTQQRCTRCPSGLKHRGSLKPS